MYKLTALDGEMQQYDAIEASKRHEDQIKKAKRSSHLIPRVSIDKDSLTEEILGSHSSEEALPLPISQYNKMIENAITIQNTVSHFHSLADTSRPLEMTVTHQPSRKRPAPTPATTTSMEQQKLQSQSRGSRTRPAGRKFSLAVPFVNDLSFEELLEFLHHKGITTPDDESLSSFDRTSAVTKIINDCKLSDSTPFEVLPTFLKNFKTR